MRVSYGRGAAAASSRIVRGAAAASSRIVRGAAAASSLIVRGTAAASSRIARGAAAASFVRGRGAAAVHARIARGRGAAAASWIGRGAGAGSSTRGPPFAGPVRVRGAPEAFERRLFGDRGLHAGRRLGCRALRQAPRRPRHDGARHAGPRRVVRRRVPRDHVRLPGDRRGPRRRVPGAGSDVERDVRSPRAVAGGTRRVGARRVFPFRAEILPVCFDFSTYFKRTTHAVQCCKNHQFRCSYAAEIGRRLAGTSTWAATRSTRSAGRSRRRSRPS